MPIDTFQRSRRPLKASVISGWWYHPLAVVLSWPRSLRARVVVLNLGEALKKWHFSAVGSDFGSGEKPVKAFHSLLFSFLISL
jgi:hypothetical protein